MVYANERTGIVHDAFCPFHPSFENLTIYEELWHALKDDFRECSYCYGNGSFWDRKKVCFNCEVDCSVWDNDCEQQFWYKDNPYCKKKILEQKKLLKKICLYKRGDIPLMIY